MNTYTAVLQLETGALRHVHVMAPTVHEARRIIASWIGTQHPDAVALVSIGGVPATPAHRADTLTALRSVQAAMLAAAMLLLLLVYILTR